MRARLMALLLCLMPIWTFANDDYVLVFADEFDQPDGSVPDTTKWVSSERHHSTWNRYIADDPRVAFIKNGCLVCRAIANPDRTADDVPMLTGARESRDRFSFTYGRVDIRLRTTLHKGNFPAAWMMPQPPAAQWPAAGEIDIFESIDAQNRAWHTVHTTWTHTLNHKSDPQYSFNEGCSVAQWHVYSLEWTPEQLTWYVDKKPVGSYARSDDARVLEQGQWPFDHPFYIILNQSVGDGSWAAAPDMDFTYETRFDYVRVYQRQPDGISTTPMDDEDCTTDSKPVYNLAGQRMGNNSLPRGLYIKNGKKFVMK